MDGTHDAPVEGEMEGTREEGTERPMIPESELSRGEEERTTDQASTTETSGEEGDKLHRQADSGDNGETEESSTTKAKTEDAGSTEFKEGEASAAGTKEGQEEAPEPPSRKETSVVPKVDEAVDNTTSSSSAGGGAADSTESDEKKVPAAASQPIAFAQATPLATAVPSASGRSTGSTGQQQNNADEKRQASSNSTAPSQPGAFSVGNQQNEEQNSESNQSVQHEQSISQENANGIHNNPQDRAPSSTGTNAVLPPSTEEVNTNAALDQNSKHAFRQECEPAVPMVAAESFGAARHTSASTAQLTEEPEEVPMIEAELVAPPVQAVHVIYDEHPEANIDPEQAQLQASSRDANGPRAPPRPMELESSSAPKEMAANSFQQKLLYLLCLLAVVLAIAIPVSIYLASHDEEDHFDMESSETEAASVGTAAPTFPYDCFSSTLEMVQAQFRNPEQNLFVMCPNTQIEMGVLSNPTAGDTRIVNGDVPLMIVRENVEVRCGLDGHVENNCVLSGGFLQVLLQPLVPKESGYANQEEMQSWISSRTDNVTIRGMTFTGQLVSDYTLGGSSVVISNPGRNMQIVDCKWENLTAPSGLVFVGTNPFQLYSSIPGLGSLGLHEADVSIVNSTFQNIIYDGSLMENVEQIFSIKGCKFQDIRLSAYASYCGYWHDNGFCQAVLYCLLGGHCTLEDICVSEFEYAGNASVLVAHTDAQITLKGANFLEKIKLYPASEGYDVCDSGFAWLDDESALFECMDNEVLERNWTAADACPF